MTWSKQYEDALTNVLAAARKGRTSFLADNKDIFTALGSISNTEMFIAANAAAFLSLPSEKFRACITALSDLESRYGDNTHASWYFVNTFSQLLALYCRAIGVANPPPDLLAHVLEVRRNSRMPFAREIGLNVKTLADYDAFLRRERERETRHSTLMEKNAAEAATKATSRMWKAIARHDMKGVAALLVKGADVHAVSPEGMSMVQYAKTCGHADIAEIIKQRTEAEPSPSPYSSPAAGVGSESGKAGH